MEWFRGKLVVVYNLRNRGNHILEHSEQSLRGLQDGNWEFNIHTRNLEFEKERREWGRKKYLKREWWLSSQSWWKIHIYKVTKLSQFQVGWIFFECLLIRNDRVQMYILPYFYLMQLKVLYMKGLWKVSGSDRQLREGKPNSKYHCIGSEFTMIFPDSISWPGLKSSLKPRTVYRVWT